MYNASQPIAKASDNMKLKKIYCEQIADTTSVCDWYECPYGNKCETVKHFYRFIQTNDDPDNIQLIDGVLFYSPNNILDQLLTKEEREQVATRWADDR